MSVILTCNLLLLKTVDEKIEIPTLEKVTKSYMTIYKSPGWRYVLPRVLNNVKFNRVYYILLMQYKITKRISYMTSNV